MKIEPYYFTIENFRSFMKFRLNELLKLKTWDKQLFFDAIMCHSEPKEGIDKIPFLAETFNFDMEYLMIPLWAMEKYAFDPRLNDEAAKEAQGFLIAMREQGLYEHFKNKKS